MKLEAIQILEDWTHEKKTIVQIMDVMEKEKKNKKQRKMCDALKPGGPLTNRQSKENLWMSSNPIPHYCVPFTRTHNLTKIRQSLLCIGSSTQKYNPYNR